MKFKFSFAVIVSVILHVSLVAFTIFFPQSSKSSGPVYYVDLMQIPGGGGGAKGGTSGQVVESGSIRDLTVKKEQHQPKMRYPDKNKKKSSSKKPKKKKELVSVVKKKDRGKKNNKPAMVKRKGKGGGLSTGISSGAGGSGSGSGGGFGSGTGVGNFPYAYYIETIRNRISGSWYSSLVSPGLKGRYTVMVYFKIYRSGRVADLGIEKESGNKSLDLSALRAIKAASPFPPLPPDFAGSFLGVHFEFEWQRK